MTTPFISLADFVVAFRALKPAEQQLAEWLLEVASDWIRQHNPSIPEGSVAAKLVVTEVVSNALRYNKYGPLSSFSEQTSHSVMSGTFADAAKLLDFTDRHRELLGIPVYSAPQYSFPANDY